MEGRPRENPCKGHPPHPPTGHTPQKEGGVADGEKQGVQLPKKPRRRAKGSETQGEGQSLKGVSYGALILPTVSQTNPYKCHKSRQPCI